MIPGSAASVDGLSLALPQQITALFPFAGQHEANQTRRKTLELWQGGGYHSGLLELNDVVQVELAVDLLLAAIAPASGLFKITKPGRLQTLWHGLHLKLNL